MKQLILFSILFLGTLLPLNAQIQGPVTDVDRNPVDRAYHQRGVRERGLLRSLGEQG